MEEEITRTVCGYCIRRRI